ncbi:hypothetical protein HYPSUDRAFT_43473 [Hypholoma sublateritium FD-334 SS-4]|uniref:Protein kinase domain-containing protein n=1 Tax=Hypholoma sublateritium (strain FD-334 SS-4) TaxID=945553 RepID=A0A0D2PJI0_HYPSF|nr:hypothetical protein HYPSUDRAFT_43473 [Hypholoma sublateritium FD-334 SS-4]
MDPTISPDDAITQILLGDGDADPVAPELFWDAPATVHWFSARGYTLYKRVYYEDSPTEWTVPSLPFDDVLESNYPYAGYDTATPYANAQPLRTAELNGKLAYAQDTELRHVAIKAIFDDSEEHRILRYLRTQSLDTLEENCILPVLDILPYGKNLCFVVMPRWDKILHPPESFTTLEVLDIIQSFLKGLAFLHSHNIVHHDMKMDNMLTDYYRDDGVIFGSGVIDKTRTALRAQGKLRYALIDYDVSFMVPPEIKHEEYTLPYFKAWIGTWDCQPYDNQQAEYEYKPFAYDVGGAGVALCNILKGHERYIPMLAPLLDTLTTRTVARRFTAAQALRFAADIRRPLTAAQLATPHVRVGLISGQYFEYDRWQHLPAEFQAAWAAYREPPEPAVRRARRAVHWWVCDHVSPHVTPYLCWLCAAVAAVPRSVWARFARVGRILHAYLNRSVWSRGRREKRA